MFGENIKHPEEKTDTGIFTVDGRKYYVLFSEAVDLKKKGEIISRIRMHVKTHSTSFLSDLEPCFVTVTSNEEVFKKRKRIKRYLDTTKTKPKFEEKVAGHNWLFYIRSNANITQNTQMIATEVERVLYETANNKRSAEHNVKRLTGSDYAKIIRRGGHYIVYLIFDDGGKENK